MSSTLETPVETRCPVLVLGIGNILMTDEGVGVRVVEAMNGMDLPPGVELFDGATAGLDLLDVLAEREKVVVIDAMDCDAEPGSVFRLTPDDLVPAEGAEMSAHDIGLMETLVLAGQIGIAPKQVVIFGIKPERVEAGLTLSASIAAVVPNVIDMVLAEVNDDR